MYAIMPVLTASQGTSRITAKATMLTLAQMCSGGIDCFPPSGWTGGHTAGHPSPILFPSDVLILGGWVSHEVMSPSCFESCEFRANFHVNPSCKQDENLALACSDTNADEVEKLLCQPRIPDSKESGGITSSSFKSFCASREILTLKGQMAGQPSTVQQKTAT